MSRPTWRVQISVTLVNGQAGKVEIDAGDLLTFRDCQDVFNRALNMARQLNAQPAEAATPQDATPRPYPRAV